MTRRNWTFLAAVALGASFGGLTGTALAAEPSATGTWAWSFNRNGEDVKITLTLKQAGDALTGTIKGPQGNETEIKNGSVKNGTVSFDVSRERDGNTFTIHYTGTLEGDSIKGKSEAEFNGEKRQRDWEAKREG